MSLHVDLFWSFRSPYSYLVTKRMRALAEGRGVDVGVRVVLPLAIRDAGFFARVNPLWPPYLVKDIVRVGQFHGIPIGWPRPDPVVQTPKEGRLVTAPEQPHIHRLSRLGVAAVERGRGLPFIDEVSTIIWSGEIAGWNEGDHLARASERAGLDLAELDRAIEADPGRFDATIERNQEDHEAAGHWGVPTMVFEGEPFFGQDRFDLLVWRLEQRGLAPVED
ncbi:MAG TPA: DsbA family protein [Myxococcota bacterium]|nr:DsbA family protein [Myxococcota bacterium]